MPKTKITVPAWLCSRCNYKWVNNRENKPIRCPDCGTPYWDIAKKNED